MDFINQSTKEELQLIQMHVTFIKMVGCYCCIQAELDGIFTGHIKKWL